MHDESATEMLLGRQTDWDDVAKRVLGLFDQPAYIRRALCVEDAIRLVESKVDAARQEMLTPVRRALQKWWLLISAKPSLEDSLDEVNRAAIGELFERVPIGDRPKGPVGWLTRPAGVLRELSSAIERFEPSWTKYVESVDLTSIDHLIESYNRYYLLEKECAFRSPRAAARGFTPMSPYDRTRLRHRYAPLPRLVL